MKNGMRIYYDEEGDYLTIFVGESKPNFGEDIAEGITIFKDEATEEVIGIGNLNFRAKAKSLKDIVIDLPFEVNFSGLKV